MSYSGRFRYKSRREKYKKSVTNLKRILLFALIGGALIIAMNWRNISLYIKSLM